MSTPIRAVVVGASGYSGAQLVDFLLSHPSVDLAALFGSGKSAGAGKGDPAFTDAWPRFHGRTGLAVKPASPEAIAAERPDCVFLATPHEASLELAPALLDRGLTVLDLSGAFRLSDPALYPKFYDFDHHHPALLASAVYGLPELPGTRSRLREARLVAVPGCYPTSATLALAPLVRAAAIAPGTRPIIDATSGVSGAGRTPALKSLFCEVSLQPYNVLKHRHNPEINLHAGTPTLFTPHLGAFDRGILSTIHADLSPGVNAAKLREIYEIAYKAEPFVRVLPQGLWPSVGDVERTNFCDLAFAFDEPHNHLIVVSAIDNLVKGAAGQAVQCMNIRFGLDETLGLPASRRHTPAHAPAAAGHGNATR